MKIRTSWAAAAGLALAFSGLAIVAMAADKAAEGPIVVLPAPPAGKP